jgi:hypothetical protein
MSFKLVSCSSNSSFVTSLLPIFYSNPVFYWVGACWYLPTAAQIHVSVWNWLGDKQLTYLPTLILDPAPNEYMFNPCVILSLPHRPMRSFPCPYSSINPPAQSQGWLWMRFGCPRFRVSRVQLIGKASIAIINASISKQRSPVLPITFSLVSWSRL